MRSRLKWVPGIEHIERVARAYYRASLAAHATLGKNCQVLGKVIVHGGGLVDIGADVILDAELCAIEFVIAKGAELHIGAGSVLEAGVSIEARQAVHIGCHCRLERFCKVLDSQMHSLSGNRHASAQATPVVIEDHARVGTMAVLLPGAFLESGAIVNPGQVVSRRIKKREHNFVTGGAA
jgi:acetyltransferase-like isoleucine patch superfamily enzyme